MSRSNLPPGVTESMIPGNRPEDAAWERLFDEMGSSGLHTEEAARRWRLGNEIADALDTYLSSKRG